MNQDSIKKLMDLIDDPDIKDTMERISENLDRVDRARDRRRNPEGQKVRVKNIRSSLDEELGIKAEKAAKGVALILTGGGGKGSYQVGVCKALAQLNLQKIAGDLESGTETAGKDMVVTEQPGNTDSIITGVAGTSAGALNAALYAGGRVDLAEKVWGGIVEKQMIGEDGFFSISEENDRYLESLIRNSGAVSGISMDSILTVVTAFDYASGYPKDFILNKMPDEKKVKCLLASAAFPVALKEQDIAGIKYIDGGIPVFGSNMPVAPLYHLGFRRFIVIHCSSRAEASEWAEMNRIGVEVNQEQYYNGAAFVHLYSKRDLGGIMAGTANFAHDYILRNIDQGYRDMMANQNDLSVLGRKLDELDEIHVADGESYRSYKELLEHL